LQWHRESWTQVEKYLNTDIYSGLTDNEAERRLKESYTKDSHKDSKYRFKKVVFKEVAPLWILNSSTILYILFYFNYFTEALFLSFIIGLSFIIKVYYIFLSQGGFVSLYKIDKSFTHVIRQNAHKQIKIKDLVLGDIVFLGRGNIVPADIRICESTDLKINEKQITGQEVPSEKYETKIPNEINSLSEVTNMAFKGTVVTEGEGIGIVVEKGKHTELGKIIESFNNTPNRNYTLINNVEGIFNYIGFFMILILVVLIILFYNKGSLNEYIHMINSFLIIYASIPVTISLHVFSYFMKREFKSKDIEIKDMALLDRIKNVDAILIDKVGSLSEKDMFVKEIYIDEELTPIFKVNSNDYTFTRLMEIALLCNDASYDIQSNKGKGNIQEVALLRLAAGKFIYKGIIDSKFKRIMELPYEPDKRIKTTVNMVEEKYRVNIKGAVDYILDNCTHFMKDGVEKELTLEDIENIKNADYEMSSRGLSTMGFAYRNFNYEPSIMENLGSNLVFVGVIGLDNPIMQDSTNYINALRENNIETRFITEDNKITAYSTAAKLGMVKDMSQVTSGVEINFLDDKELLQVVKNIKVYSRISSEHREKIVHSFKEENLNLAVTGEKISDLPALGSAYLGISIGKSCSFNLKKLSDVYIDSNYLSNFVYLIRNGKRNFNSLVKVLNLFMFTLLMEMLLYYFYNINTTYLVNAFILPLCAINALINNKSIESKVETINIRNIISILEVFKVFLYFGLCSTSYYYSLKLLGFLYKESALFILITIILMRSFDYSVFYKKKLAEKLLYIALGAIIVLIIFSYYHDLIGISAILLNIGIIMFIIIVELISLKWTK